MDDKDFRQEVLSYIDDTLNQFEKYQSITIEILKEFDRICRKNSINYWVAYGTLLGIIRDSGQIPWDYDIDVIIPHSELKDLKQALKKDLSEGFYYVFTDTMPNYPANCLRVCLSGYDWKAFHVDVFFLIGTPDKDKEKESFIKQCVKYKRIRQAKFASDHFLPKSETIFGKILNTIHRCRYFYISSRRLNRIQNKLCSRYPLNNSQHWYTYGGQVVMPKDIFKEKEVIYNGFYVKIPYNSELFLDLNYSDWRSYLSIKDRFEEFYKMKIIVDQRQKEYSLGKNER